MSTTEQVKRQHIYLIAGWLDEHGGMGHVESDGPIRLAEHTAVCLRDSRLELLYEPFSPAWAACEPEGDGPTYASIGLHHVQDVVQCDGEVLVIELDNDNQLTVTE